MLAPRFTVRTLLVLTLLAALACLVLVLAIRGDQHWAAGVSGAMVATALFVAINAVLATILRGLSLTGDGLRPAEEPSDHPPT